VDTRFRLPPALVRCIANTYKDAAVLEDLGLLNIPVLDLDSEDALYQQKTIGPVNRCIAEPGTRWYNGVSAD
jgi:hypothetical protein